MITASVDFPTNAENTAVASRRMAIGPLELLQQERQGSPDSRRAKQIRSVAGEPLAGFTGREPRTRGAKLVEQVVRCAVPKG